MDCVSNSIAARTENILPLSLTTNTACINLKLYQMKFNLFSQTSHNVVLQIEIDEFY